MAYTKTAFFQDKPRKLSNGAEINNYPLFIVDLNYQEDIESLLSIPTQIFIVNDHYALRLFQRGRGVHVPMGEGRGCSIIKLCCGLRLIEPAGQAVVVIPELYEDYHAVLNAIVTRVGRENVQIVVDETQENEALIDSRLFICTDEYELTKPWRFRALMYAGDTAKLRQEDVNALLNVIAINGGRLLRTALPSVDGRTEKKDMETIYEALWLGKRQMLELHPEDEGKRFSSGIERYDEMSRELHINRHSMPICVLPSDIEFVEHITNLYEEGRRSSDVRKLWAHALKGSLFDFGHEFDAQNLDMDKIISIGRVLGVDIMIDSYESGIPIDDILA